MGLAALLLPGLTSSARAYTPNATDSGHVIRWGDPAVGLRVDDAFAALLPGDGASQALQIAMEAWRGMGEAPDVLRMDGEPAPLGYHRGRAANTVSATTDWPYEPEKLAVTVITYEQESGRLLDADILVNAQTPLTLASPGQPTTRAYDLAAVLTHEVGHFLGLGESEDDPAATMWPYATPGDTHQRTLSEDDEEAVINAYSQALPAVGCGQARVLGARPRSAHRGMLALGAVALALLCVRRRRRDGRLLGLAALALCLLASDLGHGRADTEQLRADLPGHAHGVIDAAAAEAQRRMRGLTADTRLLRMGRALRGQARWEDGRLLTPYTLTTDGGETLSFTVVGGELDGIVQRLAEQPLPQDGARLAVAMDTLRWAHAEDGVLRGGSLGHGPGVRID